MQALPKMWPQGRMDASSTRPSSWGVLNGLSQMEQQVGMSVEEDAVLAVRVAGFSTMAVVNLFVLKEEDRDSSLDIDISFPIVSFVNVDLDVQ